MAWALTDLLSSAGKTAEAPATEKVAQLPVSLDKLHKTISELQGRLVQEQCEEAKIEQARISVNAEIDEAVASSKQKQADIQHQLDELRGRMVAIVQQAGIKAEVVRR